jgi:hydroxymethylglutaryl-CoA reductase
MSASLFLHAGNIIATYELATDIYLAQESAPSYCILTAKFLTAGTGKTAHSTL